MLLGSAGCDGSSHWKTLSIEERWNSQDRGRLVFVSTDPKDSSNAILVLRLPSMRVQTLSTAPEIRPSPFPGPQWSADGSSLYAGIYAPFCGLSRIEVASGIVTPFTFWREERPGDTLVHTVTNSGSRVSFHVPLARYNHRDLEFSRGAATVTVYAIRSYEERPDPLPILRRLDNVCAETGTTPFDLLSNLCSYGNREHGELIAIDSAGDITVLRPVETDGHRGLAVSRDESLFVFCSGEDLLIYDRRNGETLVAPHPMGFRIFGPVFSPDGGTLAVVGWDAVAANRAAILLSHSPDLTDFHILTEFSFKTPFRLRWSSSGEWILVSVSRPVEGLGSRDLVLIEASTGAQYELPIGFIVDGRRDARYGIDNFDFDWAP